MEIAIIFAIIVVVAVYYGLFDSVETAARMGNRKMDRLEAEQIKLDIDYYKSNAIAEDEYKTAVETKEQYNKFRAL